MELNRGVLVVLEGCDRCGKSTQVQKIVETLNSKNIPAQKLSFPDRTTFIGKAIDSYLKSETELSDQAIHLLFSANRWEAASKMEELLKKGISLIVDRYSFSGVAYSYAKKGALDLQWYKNPESGLPKPDIVFYLDLDVEVMKARGGFGEERYENPEFQEAVKKIFRELQDENWKIIDADQSKTDLTKLLVEETLKVIENNKNLPISRMW